MDYNTFSKPKMWTNVVGGIVCYILFAYEFYASLIHDSSITSSLLFLLWAVNCTFRVFSYVKLSKIRKSTDDESQFVKAERRQGIIITIFSNATAVLVFLVLLIRSIMTKGPIAFDVILGLCTICFGVILVQTIQNLSRFDRL